MTSQTSVAYACTPLDIDAAAPAAVISAGQYYFYRFGPVLLDISHGEFKQIIHDAQHRYFSTALTIHQRLEKLHAAYQVLVQPHLDHDPLADQVLPHKYLVPAQDEQGAPIEYEIVRIRIRQSNTDPHLNRQGLCRLHPAAADQSLSQDRRQNYWAEVIRSGEQFFYRVGHTLIDISKEDYCRVIDNPNLYHLSTALYLHRRISRINHAKAADAADVAAAIGGTTGARASTL